VLRQISRSAQFDLFNLIVNGWYRLDIRCRVQLQITEHAQGANLQTVESQNGPTLFSREDALLVEPAEKETQSFSTMQNTPLIVQALTKQHE
jgi:hypothetical protein